MLLSAHSTRNTNPSSSRHDSPIRHLLPPNQQPSSLRNISKNYPSHAHQNISNSASPSMSYVFQTRRSHPVCHADCISPQLFYAATPIVAPVVIGTLLTRFSLEDRASRKRIKCLEKGGSEDAERRSQLKILEQMEEELDEVVTSLVGVDRKESLLAAHPPSPPASSPAPPSTSSSAASSTTSLPNSSTSPSADDCKNAQPALTPAQRRMISNLNAIPHLEKRVAMCDTGVYNHGTIVCRQPKRLPLHARGAGIVKHWADFWVL